MNVPVKATLVLMKNRVSLPIGPSNIELNVNNFNTVHDLAVFLKSSVSANVSIQDSDGSPLNSSTSITYFNSSPVLIQIDKDLYKITPPSLGFQLSYTDLYDSLNLSAFERKLLQTNIRELSKLYLQRNMINKNVLLQSLNGCIKTGKNEKDKILMKYKELSLIYGEMVDEYNSMKNIGEKYARRVLWTGLALLSLECAYVGIGTYVYFSWDIMEPQAYIINSGNALLIYAAYALRKQNLSQSNMFTYLTNKKISDLSKSQNFDLEKFQNIKKELELLKSQV